MSFDTTRINQAKVDELVQLVRKTVAGTNIDLEHLTDIQVLYQSLNIDDKCKLFEQLIEKVEVVIEKITPLIQCFSECGADPVKWRQNLDALRLGIESPRKRLFEHFIRLPGGLKFLLNLRADVLSAQRHAGSDLGPLDHDLVDIFESWFQSGFLFLQEITLDSPLRQIELIMNGDMVHPMTSLEEMSHRLGRDRRCFALYHRVMPEEPVIFIEVALTKGMLRTMYDIIHPDEEQKKSRKDTAIFYSINNTQNGLSGLGMGKLLIFQVVEHLKMEAPEIRNFATLSPMPGFWRRFMLPILEGRSDNLKTTYDELEKVFDKKTRAILESHYLELGGEEGASFQEVLIRAFSSAEWSKNEALVKNLARPLTRLGHIYLAEEKDRADRPLDPVANFHLSNDASLYAGNINFGSTWTPLGLERSLSMMVNYVYGQAWMRQISETMTRVTGLLPWLSRPWSGRPVE